MLQSVGIGLFVLPLHRMPAAVGDVAWVIVLAALVATVVTGFDYLRRGWAVRRSAR